MTCVYKKKKKKGRGGHAEVCPYKTGQPQRAPVALLISPKMQSECVPWVWPCSSPHSRCQSIFLKGTNSFKDGVIQRYLDSKPGSLPCFSHSLFHRGRIISPALAKVPPLGNKKFGADNHRQTSAKTDYYRSQEHSSPFFREREISSNDFLIFQLRL